MQDSWQIRFEREAEARAHAEERYQASKRRRALMWAPLVLASLPFIFGYAVVTVLIEHSTWPAR